MRSMGGLRTIRPVTYLTMLTGAFANAGFPPFSGFFSKDTIVEALHEAYAAGTPGALFAYLAALGGVFVGGFYSFRLIFLTFHGSERLTGHDHGADETHGADRGSAAHAHAEHGGQPHEATAVVTIPLILLAIPSIT